MVGKNGMKIKYLIKQLEPYKDFDVHVKVHLEVTEEDIAYGVDKL